MSTLKDATELAVQLQRAQQTGGERYADHKPAHAVAADARAIVRASKRVSDAQTWLANNPASKHVNDRIYKATQKAKTMLAHYGIKLTYQSDPRGCPFELLFPCGRKAAY